VAALLVPQAPAVPPQNILLLLSQVNYNGTILVPEIEENNEYQ